MTLTARQLYFEAVKVGDELPPLVKPPVDRLQIARYVGAAGDWNPLYIDEPHAKSAGFPSAFAPGMLALGFLGELTTDWVRGARLRKLQGRFVKIVWPHDVLTARGRVNDRRFEPGGVYTIDIEVWAENQRGELLTRGLATYQLYYSAEDEARQRAGHAPLLVTPEEEEARLARLSRAQPSRPPLAPRPLQPARPIATLAPPPPSVAVKAPGAPARTAPPARPAATTAAAKPAPKPALKPAPKPALKAQASPAAAKPAAARKVASRKPAPRKPTRKPDSRKPTRQPDSRKAAKAAKAAAKATRKAPRKGATKNGKKKR